MTEKTFDIIVYGATSFVGQILTRYMQEQFGDGSLSWAIAGRSPDKLQQLSDDIGLDGIEMVIADAKDEAALTAMCHRSKVVISTVGPYALYGDLLVKACVETGTDYCDLTGEPHWIRKMILQHADRARETGARIVHCCGFDSIPSDLGVHFLQSHAMKEYGQPCETIAMRVAKAKGGASGGTVASMINLVKEASANPEVRRELKNPYSLCPPDHDFSVRQRSVSMEYDERYGAWIAPFIMAAINTRVVHRSNALSGNAYGTQFKYEEAMATGKGSRGKRRARMASWGLGALMAGIAIPPVRWVLESFILPKSGEGPSEKEQREGMYDLVFLGTTADGQQPRARVTGDRDPGYGSTAKMLGQAAACLAQDVPQDTSGGFWTPATLQGDDLIDRLRKYSGLTFEIES